MLALRGVTFVPWDTVCSWSPEQVMAAQIVAGEAQGGVWDWNAWQWREPQT